MARERAQRILRLVGRRRDRVPLALVAEMQERHEPNAKAVKAADERMSKVKVS
jgi:hypothetical protein